MSSKYIAKRDGIMSFREIADILSEEEGKVITEANVRQIYCRAIKKLKKDLETPVTNK